MNLKNLNDADLLDKTEQLAQREREILTDLLHHLKEIDRRRLYSTLGFRSLFEYAVKTLGFSEDQTYRRIEAMRALNDLPEIEEKISSGAISLTNLNLAQKLFRNEKKETQKEFSRDEKMEIIEKLENLSTREAEKVVFTLSSAPALIASERIRTLSDNLVEIKITADEGLKKKIEKLKGLLAHSDPHLSISDLFHKLCDLGIEKWDPAAKIIKTTSAAPRKRCAIKIKHRTTIPATLQREVWRRDQSQCRNCNSQFAVEIDHIVAKALGGTDELENLRLLCRSCNQRAAIETFGLNKMHKFLERPPSEN